jgi:hypothetical protein
LSICQAYISIVELKIFGGKYAMKKGDGEWGGIACLDLSWIEISPGIDTCPELNPF